jgi:hypothetical protein
LSPSRGHRRLPARTSSLANWHYPPRRPLEEKTRELFALEADPGELRNLVETEPRRATELDAMVVAWRARTVRQQAPAGHGDDETRARLRALGYVE